MKIDRAMTLIGVDTGDPAKWSLAIIAGVESEKKTDPETKSDLLIKFATFSSTTIAHLSGVSSEKIAQAKRIGSLCD